MVSETLSSRKAFGKPPHAEPADYLALSIPFLGTLILRQVYMAKPTAIVPDRPHSGADTRNLDGCTSRKCLLIERVRDELPDGMTDIPAVQHALDVEVEVADDP